MASWKLVLADDQGTTLTELPTATGIKFEFRRNFYGQCEFSISHADDAAYLLLNCLANSGIPTLRAYRDGVLRFNGYLAPFAEELEESTTMNLVFRGPFARLLGDGPGRGRFTGEYDPYFDDAGLIAKELIDTTNAESFTGLATPVDPAEIPTTKTRDRAFEYANIGESILDLSRLQDGFDFEESYAALGSTLAELVVMVRQGSDSDARFAYGPGTQANARSVRRETAPPANVVRVFGSDGQVGEAEDAASRAKYEDWPMHVSATDVEEQAILNDRAQALLRPDPIRTVNFTPELAMDNCPRPWDDFWLADTVRIYGRRDSFEVDETVRVNEIAVVVDDNGNETAEIPDPMTPGEEATLRASLSVEIV